MPLEIVHLFRSTMGSGTIDTPALYMDRLMEKPMPTPTNPAQATPAHMAPPTQSGIQPEHSRLSQYVLEGLECFSHAPP